MTRLMFSLLLLLAACDRRPPAPNAAQNAQLDEVEAMLNDMGNESEDAR